MSGACGVGTVATLKICDIPRLLGQPMYELPERTDVSTNFANAILKNASGNFAPKIVYVSRQEFRQSLHLFW